MNLNASQISDQRGPGWAILNAMYATKQAPDLSGRLRDLEIAGIRKENGAALYNLIRRHRPQRTLETGFAYGFSTLFILQALADNGGGHHEAIDPVETHRWHGVGLANVRLAGFEPMFTHLEMMSQIALPSHMINGEQFDFIFLDGSHLFDDTLLDFYYADRLIQPGGIIALDDFEWMPAVRSVTNFVETNLPYEVIPHPDAPNLRALRKVAAEPRAWNHFVPFPVPSVEELKSANAPAAA
jgi:predicted O-methyltransferase YrrM